VTRLRRLLVFLGIGLTSIGFTLWAESFGVHYWTAHKLMAMGQSGLDLPTIDALAQDPSGGKVVEILLRSSGPEEREMGLRLLCHGIGDLGRFQEDVRLAVADPDPRLRMAAYRAVAGRFYMTAPNCADCPGGRMRDDAFQPYAWALEALAPLLLDEETRVSAGSLLLCLVTHSNRLPPDFYGLAHGPMARTYEYVYYFHIHDPDLWDALDLDHRLTVVTSQARMGGSIGLATLHQGEPGPSPNESAYLLPFVLDRHDGLRSYAVHESLEALSRVDDHFNWEALRSLQTPDLQRTRDAEARALAERMDDLLAQFRKRGWPRPPDAVLDEVARRFKADPLGVGPAPRWKARDQRGAGLLGH
jgi:hypothetical protein